MDTKRAAQPDVWRWLAWGVVGALSIFVLSPYVVSFFCGPGRAQPPTCGRRLGSLGYHFIGYAEEHGGEYPPLDSLEAIRLVIGPYCVAFVAVSPSDVARNPVRDASALTEQNVSYVYLFRPVAEGGPVLLDKQGIHALYCHVIFLQRPGREWGPFEWPDARVIAEFSRRLPPSWYAQEKAGAGTQVHDTHR